MSQLWPSCLIFDLSMSGWQVKLLQKDLLKRYTELKQWTTGLAAFFLFSSFLLVWGPECSPFIWFSSIQTLKSHPIGHPDLPFVHLSAWHVYTKMICPCYSAVRSVGIFILKRVMALFYWLCKLFRASFWLLVLRLLLSVCSYFVLPPNLKTYKHIWLFQLLI